MADNGNVYFMSAVGFKPPHKGHIEMIKEAVKKAASMGSNYRLFIGQAPRDGITLDQSIQMLKIFLNGEDVSIGDESGQVSVNPVPTSSPTGKVYGDNPKNRKLGRVGKKVYTNSPLQPMINMAAEMPEGSTIIVPTSSEDADRAEKLKKILSYSRPDIEVEGLIVEPTAALEGEGKLSATDMRKAINGDDFEKFKKFIPDSSLDKAGAIWTSILGREEPVKKITANELTEIIVECFKASVNEILNEGPLGRQYDMDQADIEDSAVEIGPGAEEPKMRLKDLHRKYYPEEGESATEAGGKDAVAGKPPREQGDYPDHWYADYIHSYNAIKARKVDEAELTGDAVKGATKKIDDAVDKVAEASSMAAGHVEGAPHVKKEDRLVQEIFNYLVETETIKVEKDENQ